MQSLPLATADSAAILLPFNARNQLWVDGDGTLEAPWRPVELGPTQTVRDAIAETWPEAGEARQAFLLQPEEGGGRPVWWFRWDHSLREHPSGPGGGSWQPLNALQSRLASAPEALDPIWETLLPAIREHAIQIPYLNFGPNQFIYRFRTDRQRNREVYQDNPTSQALYQSGLCAAVKSVRRLKENRSGEPAELDFGAVRYLLPSHFGFCLGVQNAIERAYEVIAEHPGRRVFMLSELIHNPFVNDDLQRRGLRYLQTDKGRPVVNPQTGLEYWEELSPEDVVVIPAFGATNEDKVRLVERGLPLNEYDATCMLVEKVWKAARRFSEEGYTVLIHGKAEHEETKATFSNTAQYGPALVLRDLREAELLSEVIAERDPARKQASLERHFAGKTTPGFDARRDLARMAVVNQTTLLRNETIRIIELLEGTVADLPGAELHAQSRGDTLCYATQVNQDALQNALATPLDLALVAGGKNSSNTYQLYRVCAQTLGKRAHYIQSEANIAPPFRIAHYHFAQKLSDPLAGTMEERSFTPPRDRPLRVLVTGGASCPDGIIQQIICRINSLFPAASLRPLEAVLAELEAPAP